MTSSPASQASTCRAFTLIELLVVVAIISLLVALLLPTLAKSQNSARQMKNAVQIRSIHTCMNLFAQSNRGFYPGIKGGSNAASDFVNNVVQEYASGAATNTDPFARSLMSGAFRAMLRQNYLLTADMLSPGEPQLNKRDYTLEPNYSLTDPGDVAWIGVTTLKRQNYSYGMFAASERTGFMYGTIRWQLSASTSKPLPWDSTLAWNDTQWYQVGAPIFLEEWQANGSATTPMVTDRIVAADSSGDLTAKQQGIGQSLWVKPGEPWQGTVAWNDGHTTWVRDHTQTTWTVGRAAYTGKGLIPAPFGNPLAYDNNARVLLRH